MLAYGTKILISVVCAIIFTFIFYSPSSCQEGGKVAVLYFANHSGFDSSGGCLSFWPLNVIFGSGKRREKWELSSGFRDMLNEKLTESGYSIVEPGYVDETLQEMGEEDPATLINELDADIMIVGDIRKFEQHRTRASSQGPTTLSSTEDSRLVAMGGVGGYYYSSTVKTNIAIYDNAGTKLENGEVNSKKTLRDFYMGVGPMTVHKGDTKEPEGGAESPNPIVSYQRLDKIVFGSDEFKNKTLFGMATMDVMKQIVAKTNKYLAPAEMAAAEGKIIYVGTGERLKENEVYINLGAGDGLKVGQRLEVFMKGLQLIDPDTGEELGSLEEEKVGAIKITKIEADHLSIAEIVEKTGDIERGNLVKGKQEKKVNQEK